MDSTVGDPVRQEPPLLSCQSVSKYFGALAAVQDLSFDAWPGEVLGIGGPNGAGKTTLFDVISGLNPASAGTIEFSGHDIATWTPHRIFRHGIARTFQFNAGFDTLTVTENVILGAFFQRQTGVLPPMRFDRKSRQQAEEALALVGLSDSANATVKHLPVYHRKLLMLAGALASAPTLVLMDEPVGGLNPHEIDEIMEIVGRIRQSGVTIILIEHVMRFLVTLSDRILIMHHGEKIYEGSAEGLARDKTVVDVYLGEGASGRLEHILEEAQSGA